MNKVTRSFVIVAMILFLNVEISSLSAKTPFPDQWLIINNVNVIDGTGSKSKLKKKLYIHNERFVKSNRSKTGDIVSYLDLNNRTIIPGLIDGHVHMSGGNNYIQKAKTRFNRLVSGGVIGVRDMAGDTRSLNGLSRAVIDGDFDGPLVRYAAIFGGKGFFKDKRVIHGSRGYVPGSAPWGQEITSVTNIPLAIAKAKGTGSTAVKLYANLNKQLVNQLTLEAHAQQMKVWTHATIFPAKPSDIVDAGSDVISHAMYLIWEAVDDIGNSYTVRAKGPFDKIPFDHPKIVKVLKQMAEKQILLDETLFINFEDENKARGQWAYDVTRLAHKLGVPLVAGTDGMLPNNKPEGLPNIHFEMELLVTKAGLSPLQAIKTATLNGAKSMGIEKNYGTIENGKVANFIVLAKSPENDITNTKQIDLVFKNGKLWQ